MPLTQYSTPANINDLSAALQTKWSGIVAYWFQEAIAQVKKESGFPDNKVYLFEELTHPEAAAGAVVPIPWNAYPRKYTLAFANEQDRLFKTEQLYNSDLNNEMDVEYYYAVNGSHQRALDLYFRDQDEYCEWHPTFDSVTGKLKKITFSCENPEYWTFISENNKPLLLQLYQALTGGNVTEQDLYFQNDIFVMDNNKKWVNQKGMYNPYNIWNTTNGIVHLTHPANSLSAEVFLAGDATIVRKDASGNIIQIDKDLICCAGYGNPNRSSDPTIGSKVNGIVRTGVSVTLNDPVGLYIKEIDSSGIVLPAGVNFDDCWKIIRGKQNMILRAEFALPDGSDLAQVTIGGPGNPLKYGGQLAELITMVIYGKGFDFKNGASLQKTCICHCCTDPNYPALIDPIDIKKPCSGAPVSNIATFESVQKAGINKLSSEKNRFRPKTRRRI